MAYSTSIRKGDYGTPFDFVFYDGSTSTRMNLSSTAAIPKAIFSNGYTANSTKTLTKRGTGSSGVARYTSTNGFFSVAGTWRVSLECATSGGAWHSTTYEFTVEEAL